MSRPTRHPHRLGAKVLAGLFLLLSLFGATSIWAAVFDVVYGTGYSNPYHLYSLNQTNGTATNVYANYPPGGAGSAALAQRASDGMIFYITGTSGDDRVYRWNPATPATAPVFLGTTGSSVAYLPRMAFAQNGVLYAINTGGTNLYTINQTTGAATSVATFTNPPSGGGDFTFSPDGTIYLVSGSNLYQMPLAGGAAVNLGAITGGTGSFVGMAYNTRGENVIINDANPASLYTLNTTTRVATVVGAAGAPGTNYGDLASAPGQYITGTVFEDVNYGGGVGRSRAASGGVGRPNVQVELYDASGNFIVATTTNASGNYQFAGAAGQTYFIRVVNSSVTSSRGGAGLIPVQTFRTNASSGTAVAVTDRVGGETPTLADAGNGSTTLAALNTATTTAQSVTTVTTSTVIGGAIPNIDFGFNFDTIVNVNDSGQGSLRRFIINSNGMTGADSSIFMISDGLAHPGLRAGLANQLTTGVARIVPTTALPTITDSNTTIDGSTQTTNIGNTNAAVLGTGGTVGVDNLSVGTVAGPEVEIRSGAVIANGLVLQGGSPTVRGLAILGFGAANGDASIRLVSGATGALIENNVLGPTATSFTDPGAALRNYEGVDADGATGGTIRNNLLSFNGRRGIFLQNSATGWTVTGNEIRDNGLADADGDGISINVSTTTVTGNRIAGSSSQAIALTGGSGNILTNNTISGNGVGTTGSVVQSTGITLRSGNSATTFDRNVITANYGAGLAVNNGSTGIRLTRNSFFDNGTITARTGAGATGQIGIDLNSPTDNQDLGTAPFYTQNAAGARTGGNDLLNFPVVTTANIVGGNLVLSGFAKPGAVIEFFIGDGDPSGFGEGKTYLTTFTEGSGQDTDPGTGTYNNPVNGLNQGTDTTNKFTFSMSVPGGVSAGTKLTATATLSNQTSEFSGVVTVATSVSVSGKVFEDVNYGGGAGRDLTTSSGIVRPTATVELYDNAGAYLSNTTTDAAGLYTFSGLSPGDYTVRVVNNTVTSSRTGYLPGLLAVQTFRTNGLTGTVGTADPDRVGGENPAVAGAGAAGSGTTMNTTTGVFTAGITGQAQSITTVTLGASSITGIDFGFNFDTIVNKNDSDQGSLRQFVLNANALSNSGLAQSGRVAGKDNAIFMISNGTAAAGLRATLNYFVGGIATVAPTSTLPVVTDPVVIDATIQPGFISTPIIELTGTGAGAGVTGLSISAGSSVVRGMIVNSFLSSGIALSGAGGSTIEGNYLGTNAAGTAASQNDQQGLYINGSPNNTIGGTTAAQRNVISGNRLRGILISGAGATGNTITGNYVGLNAPGTGAAANIIGIYFNGSGSNTLGGTAAGAGNVISGNTQIGVYFVAAGSTGNVVQGNLIGLNATASGAVPNGTQGVEFVTSASSNTIGGLAAGAPNIIASNGGVGVRVTTGTGNGILRNSIYGNTGLGIDLGLDGVTPNDGIKNGAQPNSGMDTPVFTAAAIVGANLTVSGYVGSAPGQVVFSGARVEIFKSDRDPSGSGEGPTYLGFLTTDAIGGFSGSVSAGSLTTSDAITATATDGANNTSEFSANVELGTQAISGKVFEDVNYGGGAGRDLTASSGVGRPTATVEVYNNAGAYLTSTTTDATGLYTFTGLVAGNYTLRVVNSTVTSSRSGYVAGLLPAQTFRTNGLTGSVGTADPNRVGGENPAAVDAGAGSPGTTMNTATGVFTAGITGQAQSITTIAVGTGTITGIDFGFNFDAVVNVNGSGQGSLRQVFTNANTLGGDASLAQAGLVAAKENVVFMISNGTSAPGLRAANNYFVAGIGTIAPLSPLPQITSPLVIDAQRQPGWTSTPVVELNGTSASGDGIYISAGSSTVRGLIVNRFSGAGIYLITNGGNLVAGNYLGTNSAGTAALANSGAGVILSDTPNNIIGGTAAGAGNVISGNTGNGLTLAGAATNGTLVQGNRIGTDASGALAIGNTGAGISVGSGGNHDNIIGGSAGGAPNIIAFNGDIGVRVNAGVNHLISRNAIHSNGALGIDLNNDGITLNDGAKNGAQPNSGMDTPVFTSAVLAGSTLNVVGYVGSAPGQATFAGAVVEIFRSDRDPSGYGEGPTYVGSLTTDGSGNFSGSLSAGSLTSADAITGTATDGTNNTSEFGANFNLAPGVSGTVYLDVNHNSILDNGEAGTGLTLYAKIFPSSAPAGPALQAAVVNLATGAYTFSSVSSGSYTIIIDDNNTLSDVTPTLPAGYAGTEQSNQTRSNVAVTAVALPNQNFGLIQALPLSGRVFIDNGTGGGTPNDGILNGGETGLAGVAVKLTDATGATVYDSATTDGAGNYALFVPQTLANGTQLKIIETNLAGHVSTGASVGNTGGTYDRATDTLTFVLATNTTYASVNFGDVPDIIFTTDNAQSALPGSTIVYAHTFTAGSAGTVAFSTARVSVPPNNSWSSTLYRDVNNNGAVDPGDTLITAPIVVSTGETFQILVQEFIPANAPLNARDTITVTASHAYANASPALATTAARTDITTVGNPTTAGLQLTKIVDKPSALPGETLTYTITYTNNSSDDLSNVVVHDATPAFTTYVSAANGPLPPNLTGVALTAPAVGATGPIRWTFVGTLRSGATATVTFTVRINQ